jgi:hypothetical protein
MSYLSLLPDDVMIIIHKHLYDGCMNEMIQQYKKKADDYKKSQENKKGSSWCVYDDNDDKEVDLYEYHNYIDANTMIYRNYFTIDMYDNIIDENEPLTIQITNKKIKWGDLYDLADKLINESGDTHHIFIEGFEYNPNDKSLILITGS